MKLQQRMNELMGGGLDISEHLGLLKGLAMHQCVDHVVEIGFRTGVSATALAASGKHLLAIDIEPCIAAVAKLSKLAPKFRFKQRDSLRIDIPLCDLLHIDSHHTHDQLAAELSRHAANVTRFIACHDTEKFGDKGQDGTMPGLRDAITSFLRTDQGLQWNIMLHLPNNNGMTVLERCSAPSTQL